jgi:hypothetical protein
MRIDESRRDDQSGNINGANCPYGCPARIANKGNPVAVNTDISRPTFAARAIDDRAMHEQKIHSLGSSTAILGRPAAFREQQDEDRCEKSNEKFSQ